MNGIQKIMIMSWIEKAELEHFRSCHKELANGLGLTATEEFRSGFMAITDFNEPQDPRRDCSAVDVYSTPNDSLSPLSIHPFV